MSQWMDKHSQVPCKSISNHFGHITYALQGATNSDVAWDNAVWSVLFIFMIPDRTGPDLKWDCLLGYSNTVTLCWVSGSVTIYWISWIMKSHLAYGWYVKFQNVHWWETTLFNHLITHMITTITCIILKKLILMYCTLLVYTKSAMSYGNTLCAISNGFRSLMNCISCSLV